MSLSPTELVLKNGSMKEIQTMLDYRWKKGWKLDRIIDQDPNHIEPHLLIYYFVRNV